MCLQNASVSKQLLLLSWVLMAGLLSMCYQSNLLASLLKVGLVPPIDNFRDVLAADLTVYMPNGTASPFMFFSYPSKVTKQLYRKNLVERGGLYQFKAGNKFPERQVQEVLNGEATIVVITRNYYGQRHMFRRAKHSTFARLYMGHYQVMQKLLI